MVRRPTPYNYSVRRILTILALVVGAYTVVDGQVPDAKLEAELKQLFPAATSFSPKGGTPPHIKAYNGDPNNPASLLGYVFWSTEVSPLERAYDGPIKILVGLNPTGKLAGVIVVEHHEPYGSFSVATPQFAAQFKGKDIRDPFQVGKDVDAISTATISVTSASRAIRLSSLRIARALLAPPGTGTKN